MKNPNYRKFVEAWYRFFELKTGLEYRFTQKDGFHLKKLMHYFKQDVDKWEEFLYSIKDAWVLENLEIPLVNSKLNALMIQKNKKPKTRKFIDHWNPDYVKHLSPQDTVEYYRHLRSLGYIPNVAKTGAVIGWKTAEA